MLQGRTYWPDILATSRQAVTKDRR